MASADNINAGGAVVSISGDTNPLQKAVEEAKSKIQKFGESLQSMGKATGIAAAVIGGIGAAITAPFAAGLVLLVDAAGGIAQAARRTGMSFEQVQDASAGFRISVEDMPGIIAKMSSAMVDARNPSSAMARNFAELGLNMDALNSASQAQRLDMIADALSNVSDEARRIDLAREILGRQAMSVNFSGGSEGVRARRERNREIGGVISNADIAAALEYSKAQNELKTATRGLSIVLGAIFAPVAQEIAQYMLGIVMGVRAWIDNNRELLGIIVRVGAALVVIGSLLAFDAAKAMIFGKAIAFVGAMASQGTMLGALVGTAAPAATAAIAPVAAAVAGTAATAAIVPVAATAAIAAPAGLSIFGRIAIMAASVGKAFLWIGGLIAAAFSSALFWPVVLVLGAIVAVAFAVYYAFGSWEPAIAATKAVFGLLWQGILYVWDAIKAASVAVWEFVKPIIKASVWIWAIVSAALVLPILGIILGALAALIYVNIQSWKMFAAVGSYLWGIVVDVYDAIVEFISGIIDSIDWVSVLTAVLIAFAPVLIAMFLPAIIAIGLLIGAYYLLMAVWDELVSYADVVGEAIASAWDDMVGAIIVLWDDMVSMIIAAWDDATSWIMDAFSAVFAYLDDAVGGMVSAVVEGFGMIGSFISDVFSSMLDIAMEVFDVLRGIVSSGIETVTAIVGDLGTTFGAIGDFISAGDWAGAFDVAMLSLQLIWERTKNWLLESWYSVTFRFGTMWDAVVNSLYGVLEPVIRSIVDLMFGLVVGIQDALNSVIRGINSAIGRLPRRLRPALLGEVDLVGDARANVDAALNAAFAPQAPREQQQVDRTAQLGLEGELEARRRQAALAAWSQAQDWDMIDTLLNAEVAGPTSRASALQIGASSGSFSAAALGQIGTTNYAERTAVAVEAIVGGVRRLGDIAEADEGGVVAA